MQKDLLSLLDGKTNLWKRLMLDYPAKLEKELTEEDEELQVFLYYSVMALDTCFEPSGEEKLFDLDVYQIDPVYLIFSFRDIVESLMCFYFFEHGYHPYLVKRYVEIRSKIHQGSGGEVYIKGMFEDATSVGSITRDCFLNLSEYFDIPQTDEKVIQLYCILQTYYDQIKKGLKKSDKSSTKGLSLIKYAYDMDNNSSC
ncbi:hypothetical protein [Marinifilum sp. D714]|uniref:hypothetical protein n=1 Tax=Marinifilum sp. D714 TaxID=2937523 RepID=UPI0027BC1FE3|nr:hypothetical protein [Marinifilum sp. D714]MDQ2179700.1 hypothetical protein [Marinifilum sp. D714]